MVSTGLQFTLKTIILPPQTFSVVAFEFHEAFSSPFILHVQLASADPAIDFSDVLDEDASLTIWQNGVPQRSITGLVSDFEQGDTGFHRTRYSMVIRPHLWRTTLRRNSRIFQQQDIQTIIDTLLQENGRIACVYAFRYPHPAREFCVQYQESDFEFLQRLTAEEGIFYYFEFEEGKHQVVFTDDASAQSDGAVLPYNPHKSAQAKERCISTFRRSERVRTSKVMLKDYTFKNPVWPAEFKREGQKLNSQRSAYEYYDYPGRFKDERAGSDFTRYRVEALRNDAHLGEGESNDIRMQPGELFTLHSHPRLDLNSRWQIISISHTGIQPQALEEEAGEGGTTLTNCFSFIPFSQTWRPAPLPKPRVEGPQIAVVTGPASEEIYTDNFGRVRLRFLWDRYAKDDDTSSCWIRVSQAWAGKGWGFIAIPRIGQEVLVDFLDGDPDQPIVTGRTYHANNMPSLSLPGSKTQTAFRSNTHKGSGFNELRFEDENGRQEVYIHAEKDMNTKVKHDRTTQVDNDHTETVDGYQTVNVKKSQTINVNQNESETVGGNQTLTVKQNQAETVFLNKAESIGIAKALTVGSAYQTTVGMVMNTSVGLSQSSQVGLTKSLVVGKSYSFSSGESVTYSVGTKKTETVGKVSIHDVGEHFELVCGKAKIVLTKDGGIFLKGEHIELQANNALNGDANLTQWNCGASQAPPDAPE